ncbi:MAG: hypothetical protein HYT87_05015 [Nitrospirae bacterium]|nr:hypothetical protein [Nitrospirota bacterium]
MKESPGFTKKGYTLGEFVGAFSALRPAAGSIIRLYAGPNKLETRLRERIMLSVALTNDCRH